MIRIKLWLIVISVGLITLDKFSFISKVRDSSAIYIQKQLAIFKYKLVNYPKFILLRKKTQQDLEKENQRLKKQLEEYDILVKQKINQETENNAIQALHNQKNHYNNYNSTIAKAIIDINYFVNNKLLIDKGQEQGIKVGQAVINKDGVIGQVSIANPKNAQISLITNPNLKIYLQNSKSESKMLAQGMGNNNLLVKFINKKDPIEVGDILVTTGLDDIYPANIPAAKITKIFYENNGFNSAICEPIVDFNKLQFVLVLKHAN